MKKILFLMLFAVSAGGIAYGSADSWEQQAKKYTKSFNKMCNSKNKDDFKRNTGQFKKSSKELSDFMRDDEAFKLVFRKPGIISFGDFFANLAKWIG